MVDTTVRGTPGADPAAADATQHPRVLVVAPQPFYSDRGTPIALRHTLEALSGLGYRADVLTYPIGESLDIPGVRYFRVSNPLGLRSVPIGFSLRKLWLDLFVFFGLLRRLRTGEYACVHAVEEAAFLAALARRFAGVPVIYDMQSSLAEQMSRRPALRNAPARRTLEACERWLIRNVDCTVASVGLGVRARAATPRGPVREWRYPGSLPELKPEEMSRVRAELDLTADSKVVMYTGTFEEYQGLSGLVEAMPSVLERMPDTVLVLVGADRADAARLNPSLRERLPSGSYRVLSRQPRQLMSAYLAASDVAVSPREFGSNLPIKVLEYLAAGCAIVATDIPAHRAVLDESRASLVEPTPAGLAEGILELLQDGGRAEALRQAARAFASQDQGRLGFVRMVDEVYREVRSHALV